MWRTLCDDVQTEWMWVGSGCRGAVEKKTQWVMVIYRPKLTFYFNSICKTKWTKMCGKVFIILYMIREL